MPAIVVTLDIGGSGVKASCFDLAGDIPATAAAVRYASAGRPDDGTFDPGAWVATAIAALAGVVARCPGRPRDYLGITVSAIRIPFVLLDAGRQVVGPSLLNRDRRALPVVEELVSSVGHRPLHATTGHWAAPEFGLPKLIWFQRTCPAAWRRVRTIVQLHDWFVFSLCGAIASEASSAAMSQMMDVAAGTWAFDLLAEHGVRAGMMPEFAPAGTQAGGLLRTVAEQAGLPVGLPVHVGAGDTHMSALSVAGYAPGAPVVVAGTTGPVQVTVEAPADLGAWFPLLVSARPGAGGWALEANAGPTGEIVDRLGGLTGLSGQDLRDALTARGFEVEEAADGTEPLTVLAGNPFFGPDGWQAWPAPAVIGLGPGHTGADVLEAGRLGTCLAFGQILKQLGEVPGARGASGPVGASGPDGAKVVATGGAQVVATGGAQVVATGGMSRSASWNQMLADATGRTVLVPELDRVSGRAGAALVTGSFNSGTGNGGASGSGTGNGGASGSGSGTGSGVDAGGADGGSGRAATVAVRYLPDAARYAGLQRASDSYCRQYSAGQARSRENQPSRNGVDVHAGPH